MKLSSPQLHNEILDQLTSILKINSYPSSFIRSVINYQRINNNSNVRSRENNKFYSLTYIGQSSFIINNILKKLDSRICIAFRNFNTVQTQFFSKLKDPIPLLQKTKLIYKIPCSNCPLSYVGETLQHLSVRFLSIGGMKVNKNDNTALAVHAREFPHKFNFEKISILAYEENIKKRLLREFIWKYVIIML